MSKSMTRRNFLGAAAAVPLVSGLTSAVANPSTRPATDRPNILWIAVEDISPFLGCYGHANATPNLDRLAKGGVRFARAFMPAPVCSACRSALITGQMQTTLGTQLQFLVRPRRPLRGSLHDPCALRKVRGT